MLTLESARLHIREATADDLPELLQVPLSNADFLQQVEGSEGIAGRYDLERWQRDWHIAQLMPGRYILGCYLKNQAEAVGFIDYLEEHEEDGHPWLGMVMVHAAYQRQGLGTEIFHCLMTYFREHYHWSSLRAGIPEQNERGLAFAHHIGFRPIKQGQQRQVEGMQTYVVLELSL